MHLRNYFGMTWEIIRSSSFWNPSQSGSSNSAAAEIDIANIVDDFITEPDLG